MSISPNAARSSAATRRPANSEIAGHGVVAERIGIDERAAEARQRAPRRSSAPPRRRPRWRPCWCRRPGRSARPTARIALTTPIWVKARAPPPAMTSAHRMAGQQPRQPVEVGMAGRAGHDDAGRRGRRPAGPPSSRARDRGPRAAAPARGGGGTPRRSRAASISNGSLVGSSESALRTTTRQSAWRRQSSVHGVSVGSAR